MQKHNFIIGLSELQYYDNNINNLENICIKYQNIIDTWYFSPPFKEYYYNSRQNLNKNNNLKDFQSSTEIIKKYHQKIQLALNGSLITSLTPEEIEEDFFYWISLFNRPDSIVIKDYLIPYFLKYNIPLTYSYNNLYSQTKFKNLKYCNYIVLGNKDLRNITFMYKLKEKYPKLQIELLINNGCHFLCNKKCFQCSQLQYKRLQQIDIYQALAEQSLLPSELKLYPKDLISLYKISSRPLEFIKLDNSINWYSSQISISNLSKEIDLTDINNWHYFCRLVPLLKMFYNQKIDVNKVLDYKYKIWQNILQTNDFIL